MKLFLILGNQLFNTKYLKRFSQHIFYMSEDLGLCTFQKHHKLKILKLYITIVIKILKFLMKKSLKK